MTDQTPNVTIIPDPNSEEAKYFQEEATEGDNDAGTEENSTPKAEPEVDYKRKFAESTKEVQRILAERKAEQSALREKEARLEQIVKEKAELEALVQTENPAGYESHKMANELNELKKTVLLQKEKDAINEFVADNPDAKAHKDALKTLGRANPDKSYDEIYNQFIKPIYEAGKSEAEAKKLIKKQTQPESGSGSAEKTPVATDDNDFNNLSLDERKRRLKAMGL